MTHIFIAQSIVRAPDFGGTTLRVAMAMITDSVSDTESVITDYYVTDRK